MSVLVDGHPSVEGLAAVTAWLGAALGSGAAGDDLIDAWNASGIAAQGASRGLSAWSVLGRAREAGATTATLLLPAPGDPAGVPGPTGLVRDVLAAGAVILLHDRGDVGLALIPDRRRGLTVVPTDSVYGVRSSWPTVAQLRREADEAVRAATAVAEGLAMRRDPDLAEAIRRDHDLAAARLPDQVDPRRRELLSRGLLLLRIASVAERVQVVTADDETRRSGAVRSLGVVGNRAVCAAVSGDPFIPQASAAGLGSVDWLSDPAAGAADRT